MQATENTTRFRQKNRFTNLRASWCNAVVTYRLLVLIGMGKCTTCIQRSTCSIPGRLNKSSAVAKAGDRLATIGMGRKVGGYCIPLSEGEMGPHLTQCGLGRGRPLTKGHLIHPAVSTEQMWPNIGGCAPFWGEEGLGHYLTQCRLGRGLPPYQTAS